MFWKGSAEMVNGGIGAKPQRKLDTDAHLGKNCTGISGRKKPTLKKEITIPYKRHCRTVLVLEISDPLTAENQGMARPLDIAAGTSANSLAYTTPKYDLLRAK